MELIRGMQDLLEDQHGISVRAELVVFLDGNIVGMHQELITRKSGNHHQQC